MENYKRHSMKLGIDCSSDTKRLDIAEHGECVVFRVLVVFRIWSRKHGGNDVGRA